MALVGAGHKRVLTVGAAARGVFSTAIANRVLISRLAGREVQAKYRGSLLGIAWAVLNPLLLLAVYTVVFSGVFRMRWSGTTGGTGEFALLAFSGLIVFNLFSECVMRAPGLMLENVSYIKKVVFPLEIMPYVQLYVSLFGALVSFAVLLVVYPFVFGLPPLTALLLPVLLLPLLLMVLGLSWFLASVGVFLRDVRQVIAILTTVVMFASPILFPADMVPEPWRGLMAFGPLLVPLEQIKEVLFWGRLPAVVPLLTYSSACLCIAIGGFWWFKRTCKAFADVV